MAFLIENSGSNLCLVIVTSIACVMNLAILLTIQTLNTYFAYIYQNAKHPSAPGRKIHDGLKRISWLAATNYGISRKYTKNFYSKIKNIY